MNRPAIRTRAGSRRSRLIVTASYVVRENSLIQAAIDAEPEDIDDLAKALAVDGRALNEARRIPAPHAR